MQGGGDASVLYDGLVARVEDELDLFEALPQLLEQQQQQEAGAAADAAGTAACTAAGSAAMRHGCSWCEAGKCYVQAWVARLLLLLQGCQQQQV
jgi:hypothetical protein